MEYTCFSLASSRASGYACENVEKTLKKRTAKER
jgi:hypothetical protein